MQRRVFRPPAHFLELFFRIHQIVEPTRSLSRNAQTKIKIGVQARTPWFVRPRTPGRIQIYIFGFIYSHPPTSPPSQVSVESCRYSTDGLRSQSVLCRQESTTASGTNPAEHHHSSTYCATQHTYSRGSVSVTTPSTAVPVRLPGSPDLPRLFLSPTRVTPLVLPARAEAGDAANTSPARRTPRRLIDLRLPLVPSLSPLKSC